MNKLQTLLIRVVCVSTIISIEFSCKKIDDFLNVKSNITDVRPSSLDHYQAILNDNYRINYAYSSNGLIGADNFYLTEDGYNSLPYLEQNEYLWEKDIFEGEPSYNWNAAYQRVGYCNIVLDGLKKIDRNESNSKKYDNIKGQAFFIRSYSYYMLSQLYCKPYIQSSAKTNLGIVLRNSSDVNIRVGRSSVEDTYQQMVADFKNAANLLAKNSPYQTRPSRPAANGALAKVYLRMGKYDSALNYAQRSLDEFNVILDYNNKDLVDSSSTTVFPSYPNNPEISWYAQMVGLRAISPSGNSVGIIDSNLFRQYAKKDLRRVLYYSENNNGEVHNAACYTANGYLFCGIATNEIYLIKAECEVRLGNITEALNALNTLLKKRYKTGYYNEVSTSDKDSLLEIVLNERRKELPFTGQLRWEDLRRLNKESKFKKTLIRTIAGKRYTLLPNDKRYVFPIGEDEIRLNGLKQNER